MQSTNHSVKLVNQTGQARNVFAKYLLRVINGEVSIPISSQRIMN